LSELTTRKTGSITALRSYIKTKGVGRRKYYCMTVQLDDMIRELYPKSGATAIANLMAVIAPELKAGKKADFSLFKDELKARYAVKYRGEIRYMEQHLAIESDFTEYIPLFGYIFSPKEDTVENATTAYMVGLYIMFIELAFFKTLSQTMSEYDSRSLYSLSSDELGKVSNPGDNVLSVTDPIGGAVVKGSMFAMLGYASGAGPLSLYLRQSLISRGGLMGVKISLEGGDKTFIAVDVASGHAINKTDLLKKLMALYNKIITN
jgi:hypothetical protein